MRDIAERKKAEEELKDKYEVLERVGENVDSGLAIIAKDYSIIWANKVLRNTMVDGNKKCYQTFNKLNSVCPDCGVKKIFEQNLPLDIHEYKTVNSKGETIWIELRVTPLKDKNGATMAALELAVPITERKKAEDALKTSEQQFRQLFSNMPSGVAVYEVVDDGKDFVFRDFNVAAERIEKIKREKVIGKRVTDVFLGVENFGLFAVFKRVWQTGQPEYYPSAFYKDDKDPGTWRENWVYKLPNGSIVAIYNDITERKKAENDLGQSEAKFKELTSLLPEMVFEIDTRGNIVFANLRAFEITGYSKEDFKEGFNAMRLVAPEDLERAKENMQNMFTKEIRHSDEYLWIRKDGSRFPVSLSSSPIFKDDKIVGARAIMIDITERKKGEEQLKEDRHQIELMNEKLRVIGSLTRHDVGNKLMAAKSNVYLLKKRLGDNAELDKYFDGIASAFAVSDRIFEFSRLYEQIGAENPSKENVFECFHKAAALVQNLNSVKVLNECQGLIVVADLLLKKLFYNFIDNSIKHGEKVTQIRLYYTKEVDGVKLFYEDNGVGIPEANKLRLFEVGFTTGKGSGLGLALIKRMIDVYGWNIVEEGEPGKGAKFVISIPEQ